MAQLPAYAVEGGLVPASMARRVVYATSSGANGVVSVDDLRVTQLPTPGAGVQISRGAALCAQRLTGANEYESYAIAQDSSTNLTISTTGTHYVIARVTDWHFTGDPAPANPQTAQYWEFTTVSTLAGITHPYVPLAQLVIPVGTTAITDAMITDLREVAIPRRHRETHIAYVANPHDLTSSSFIDWPSDGTINIDIPEWAGHMIVRADVLESLLRDANTDGRMVLMVGWQPSYTGERRFDEVWAGSTSREDHTVISEFNIPPAYRGTTKPLRIRARRNAGTGYLRADAYTQVVYDIEFLERV